MLTKLWLAFFLLFPLLAPAQDFDVRPGHGDEPFVSNDKSKLYNRFNNAVDLYIRYENGTWNKITVAPGYDIIELDVCGKPAGTNCTVTLRIYTTSSLFREINLNGGCRYFISYDAQMKVYYFKEIC